MELIWHMQRSSMPKEKWSAQACEPSCSSTTLFSFLFTNRFKPVLSLSFINRYRHASPRKMCSVLSPRIPTVEAKTLRVFISLAHMCLVLTTGALQWVLQVASFINNEKCPHFSCYFAPLGKKAQILLNSLKNWKPCTVTPLLLRKRYL